MIIQMPTRLLKISSLVKPYVALDEGELLAYAAVTKSPEKAYEAIYDGSWEGRSRVPCISSYCCF